MVCLRHPLFDLETEQRSWIGEITHIVGLKCGSARHEHDTVRSHAWRNSFENLVLACPACATKVDADEAHYTVQKLQGLKDDHAKLFGPDAVLGYLSSFVDHTLRDSVKMPDSRSWTDLSNSEVALVVEGLETVGAAIKALPTGHRELVRMICNRTVGGNRLPPAILEGISKKSTMDLKRDINALMAVGVVGVDNDNDGTGEYIYLCDLSNRALDDFWHDAVDACESAGVDSYAVFVDLDFSVFENHAPAPGWRPRPVERPSKIKRA